MTIGRYVTSDTLRLGLFGILAGFAAGLLCRAAGRTRWGAAPVAMAVLAAAGLTGRFDAPGWYPMIAAGGVVTILAGTGAVRSLAVPATRWTWVAAAALMSAAGIWAAVPETGPAVIVGACLVGLVGAALLTGSVWAPPAGAGLAVVLGWAALSGAAGRPWAALGGTLCTGVAPWLAFGPVSWARRPTLRLHPWLLGAHVGLIAFAARWIGVDPAAGWVRVGVLTFSGGLAVVALRPRA